MEDSPDDVVLVRVYGNKTELIVDRDNELKSFQVVQKQMGMCSLTKHHRLVQCAVFFLCASCLGATCKRLCAPPLLHLSERHLL